VKNLKKHFCKQCGNCCIIHWKSFEATHDDVLRWRREGRADILKYLAIASDNPNDQSGTFTSNSCPFLSRNEEQGIYFCAINDTKPFQCRNYPEDGVCEYATNLD